MTDQRNRQMAVEVIKKQLEMIMRYSELVCEEAEWCKDSSDELVIIYDEVTALTNKFGFIKSVN